MTFDLVFWLLLLPELFGELLPIWDVPKKTECERKENQRSYDVWENRRTVVGVCVCVCLLANQLLFKCSI